MPDSNNVNIVYSESKDEAKVYADDKFIDIFLNSSGEFEYNIFNNESELENDQEPYDGGCCTGSIEDAIELAMS